MRVLFKDHTTRKSQSWDFFPGESDSNVNSKYSQGCTDHYPKSHSEFHILRRCVLNLAKTNVTEVKNKQTK